MPLKLYPVQYIVVSKNTHLTNSMHTYLYIYIFLSRRYFSVVPSHLYRCHHICTRRYHSLLVHRHLLADGLEKTMVDEYVGHT